MLFNLFVEDGLQQAATSPPYVLSLLAVRSLPVDKAHSCTTIFMPRHHSTSERAFGARWNDADESGFRHVHSLIHRVAQLWLLLASRRVARSIACSRTVALHVTAGAVASGASCPETEADSATSCPPTG
jgi:hypothetical protein